MAKTLDSVHLSGPQGTSIEIKVGEQVAFINPEVFQDGRARRIQASVMKSTEARLGPQPYKVLGITLYPSGNTLLSIKGEGELIDEICKDYFTKA